MQCVMQPMRRLCEIIEQMWRDKVWTPYILFAPCHMARIVPTNFNGEVVQNLLENRPECRGARTELSWAQRPSIRQSRCYEWDNYYMNGCN